MISNSKQSWEVGQAIRVGFMHLVVRAKVLTPGDYKPDAYILSNTAGTQLYKAVPYNGVQKISATEARELMADAERCAACLAATVMDKARADARAMAEINALLPA
ncbi:MAG: hypothetical protein KGL42_07895 [Betaproteobacteria bacterium]|nr:hypothetical protein [Betaproteobacteria bacterium]